MVLVEKFSSYDLTTKKLLGRLNFNFDILHSFDKIVIKPNIVNDRGYPEFVKSSVA
jgi:hypothetical protein